MFSIVPYEKAINLNRFQVMDCDTRLHFHPFELAVCPVYFIFCHIDVVILDHYGHVIIELQKRIMMAALVLGQISITAGGILQ